MSEVTSGVMVALFSILLVSHFIAFIVGLSNADFEFRFHNRNASIINKQYIYENSDLNMTTCKIKSFLFNLFAGSYNLAVIFYAVFYYITRVGRPGNFDKEGEE